MKRAKVLAGITNGKVLDRKDRLDRSLFAGNPVLVYGVQQNNPVCPCAPLVYPLAQECTTYTGGCHQTFCSMHQY